MELRRRFVVAADGHDVAGTRAVQVVGPSRSAVFLNLQPLVGIGLAATLLREPIGVWQILGTACILAGVALTTRARPEP